MVGMIVLLISALSNGLGRLHSGLSSVLSRGDGGRRWRGLRIIPPLLRSKTVGYVFYDRFCICYQELTGLPAENQYCGYNQRLGWKHTLEKMPWLISLSSISPRNFGT